MKDIVEAVYAAIESKDTTTLQTYNLGTGISYSVKEIIDIVTGLFNFRIEYQCKNETRPNEVMDTIADIRKIKNELNWTPQIDIIEGLKLMI